jgi:hypothetical protein
VKDKDIKHRWREYFDKLFNGETKSSTIELEDSFCDTSRRFVQRIQESEVKDALKRMKGRMEIGLDCIPIEVWRGLGDIEIVWLTKLFNLIFRAKQDARRVQMEYISINLQAKGGCLELYELPLN